MSETLLQPGRILTGPVTDGVRYRLYDADNEYTSVAYANFGRLKKSAVELFARLKRP
jgi:hypothetical protein